MPTLSTKGFYEKQQKHACYGNHFHFNNTINQDNMDKFNNTSKWFLCVIIASILFMLYVSSMDADESEDTLLKIILDMFIFPLRIIQELVEKLLTFSWIFIPIFIGTSFVVFTWGIIYIDSYVPGKDPKLPDPNNIPFQYFMTLFFGCVIVYKLISDNWDIDEEPINSHF